jgi:transmembrane sensor
VERRQALFARESSFGYRHRALTVLGLAATGLLALAARAIIEKPSALFPLEASVERQLAVSPGRISVLAAGETVTLEADSTRVQRLQAEDLRNRLAWTGGLIRLDGETLTEAVAEFNRYNRRKLTIADPTIAGLQVSGTFNAKEPESFVATLARSAGVRTLAPGSRASDSQIIRLVGAGARAAR